MAQHATQPFADDYVNPRGIPRAQFIEEGGGEGHGASSPPTTNTPFAPSEVEGRAVGAFAQYFSAAQSPAIKATFLLRDHGLMRRSASKASMRVWKFSDQTSWTGVRLDVKPVNAPA